MEKLSEIDKNTLLLSFGLMMLLKKNPKLITTVSGNIEIDNENLLKSIMNKENMDKDFDSLNMDDYKKHLNYLTNQRNRTTVIPEYCPLEKLKKTD